jgi:N utilization substance protein B
MSSRSKARQLALQMLYQKDLNEDVGLDTMREKIGERIEHEDYAQFAYDLCVNVLERRAQLDEKIVAVAENWALDRMAPTDRNALRIGAYELLFTETPPRVVIDEAIEMAKLYGSENSSQFVNGILDRLIPKD